MSIRIRLIVAFVAIIGIGAWQLYSRLVEDLRPRYLEAMEESMVEMSEFVAATISNNVTTTNPPYIDTSRLSNIVQHLQSRKLSAKIYELNKTKISSDIRVVDHQAIVLFDSADSQVIGTHDGLWNDVIKTLRGEYGARATRTNAKDPRSLVLHVAAPIFSRQPNQSAVLGAVTVRRSVDSVTIFIDSAKRNLALIIILATTAVAFVGILASAWLTRPLQQLASYINHVRSGQRIAPPQLPREIKPVAQAIEELRDELEGKQYAERYIQHLTHELKSPLASIQGAAELLQENPPPDRQQQFINNIQLETTRLRDVVDRLLQLAELEGRKHLQTTQPVNLLQTAQAIGTEHQRLLDQNGMHLTIGGDDGIIAGDPLLIAVAIRNIIINAIEFSPPNSQITVTVHTHTTATTIGVADSGPGIPSYAHERVRERFYSLPRPQTGRKSSGLGLTFVSEIAQLHNAEVAIDTSPLGGALVELRFFHHSSTLSSPTFHI